MVNRNSAPPPGARCTVIVPPCASTSPLTMYRPSPAPPRRLVPPELAEDPRHELGGDAVALVADRDRHGGPPPAHAARAARRTGSRIARLVPRLAAVSTGSTTTVTVPAPCRIAFSTRFPSIWSTLSASSQVSGSSPVTTIRNRSAGSPAATRPATIFSHPLGDADELAVDLHPARLDAGHVQQLGDQPGDPVGVGVDGLQHDPLLVVGEPGPLGQQRRREPLHAGQRGPQLVRDGGDQVGPARSSRARCCAPRRVITRCRSGPGPPAAGGLGPAPRAAHVTHGDQKLGPVVEVERHLGMAGPGGQALVGIGGHPPAAAVGVAQRQRLPDVRAEHVGGGNAGQPRRGPVEHGHPPRVVGDHQAVGQLIGGHVPARRRPRAWAGTLARSATALPGLSPSTAHTAPIAAPVALTQINDAT